MTMTTQPVSDSSPDAAPPVELKALSLWQPCASLIAARAIQAETRTWRTVPQRDLCIHAGLSRAGLEWGGLPVWREVMAFHHLRAHELPRGCIVAVADITRVVVTQHWKDLPDELDTEFYLGDWTPDRWVFVFDNIRPIKPVPCRGRQQVFRVPADASARVLAQLS